MNENEGSREGYLGACATLLKDMDAETVKEVLLYINHLWRDNVMNKEAEQQMIKHEDIKKVFPPNFGELRKDSLHKNLYPQF